MVLAAQAIRMQPVIAGCYCGEKLPPFARDLREKKQGELEGIRFSRIRLACVYMLNIRL